MPVPTGYRPVYLPPGGALDDVLKKDAAGDFSVVWGIAPGFLRGSIISPVATDDITLGFVNKACAVRAVYSHIVGSTNVVYNIYHASTRNAGSPNQVFTSNITETSLPGATHNTGFSDETIPANSWVWLNVVSVSGTPSQFHVTVEYG